MVDEFVHNNPQYLTKERFMRLEEKFVDTSRNMTHGNSRKQDQTVWGGWRL